MIQKIQEFMIYMREKKHASANTLEAYNRDLMRAASWFLARGLSDERGIREEDIREYLEDMEKENKAKSTISRNVASLHTFFHFLTVKKYIEEDPSEELRAPVAEKKTPVYLEKEQIKLLMEQPDMTSAKGIRDRTMLELLWTTGIRVSEMLALFANDVNLPENSIYIRERDIKVFFGEKSRKILQLYLGQARPEFQTQGLGPYLFMNLQGKPMSRQGFQKILKGYVKKAGINGEVTPRILRRASEKTEY